MAKEGVFGLAMLHRLNRCNGNDIEFLRAVVAELNAELSGTGLSATPGIIGSQLIEFLIGIGELYNASRTATEDQAEQPESLIYTESGASFRTLTQTDSWPFTYHVLDVLAQYTAMYSQEIDFCDHKNQFLVNT